MSGFVLAIALGLLGPGQGKAGPPSGRYHGDLRDKDGFLMRVDLQAPPPTPGLRPALLLVHHGMNGNETHYSDGILEALKRLKLDGEYVVICGKSKQAGWSAEDDPILLRVIAWAKESYGVDPRRVYLWGTSNGATFAGAFGWAHQDQVAGVVGYCGSYSFQNPPAGDPAATRPEWYFVHGGNDTPENSRTAAQALHRMGYRYVLRLMDGYGHTDIWDGKGHPDKTWVDAVCDDSLLWIHALRHKELPLSEKEGPWLAKLESPTRVEALWASKPAVAELCRIGGPAAGTVAALAMGSNSASTRAAGATVCLSGSFGPTAAAALARLADDESAPVRQAALRSLGVYGNWNYPEAHEALLRRALSPPAPPGLKLSPAERVLVIESLGRSVRLALLGNFQDTPLFWALVQALDDDARPVRAAALAALTPWSKDDLGYRPDLPGAGRKPAVDRWSAWCTQRCGPRP